MPEDTEWHMIGNLQTNKVKFIVPFVHLIQSVDSLKLLLEINREAEKIQRKISCLLQLRIAREDTKYGLTFSDAAALLDSAEYAQMRYVEIRGLMGMATFTEDTQQVAEEFALLAKQFSVVKTRWFAHSTEFSEVSMGMSGDYPLAIKAGATMIRIGSLIFGERNYNR